MCVWDRGDSRATRATAEVTVGRDESLEEVLGLCVCVLTWFLLLPSLDHFSSCPFFMHARTHTHVCAHAHIIACVWGRDGKRNFVTDRKKEICLVLCSSSLWHINISICRDTPSQNTFLNVKSGSVPPILSSLYTSCIPLLLWCIYSIHCQYLQLVCKAFSHRNKTNVRRPEPGW